MDLMPIILGASPLGRGRSDHGAHSSDVTLASHYVYLNVPVSTFF